jgi:hypothetical protein
MSQDIANPLARVTNVESTSPVVRLFAAGFMSKVKSLTGEYLATYYKVPSVVKKSFS